MKDGRKVRVKTLYTSACVTKVIEYRRRNVWDINMQHRKSHACRNRRKKSVWDR